MLLSQRFRPNRMPISSVNPFAQFVEAVKVLFFSGEQEDYEGEKKQHVMTLKEGELASGIPILIIPVRMKITINGQLFYSFLI